MIASVPYPPMTGAAVRLSIIVFLRVGPIDKVLDALSAQPGSARVLVADGREIPDHAGFSVDGHGSGI